MFAAVYLSGRSDAAAFCLVTIVSLLAIATTSEAAAPWKRAFAEKGVVVDTRAGVGGNLPEFRGQTVINARIWTLLAIVDDVSAVCEWAQRCMESREIQKFSDTRRIFYNRTGAPWPFQDRDSVMLGTVDGLKAGRDVFVRFKRVEDRRAPPIKGVVRMPVMDGSYRFTALGPGRTRVTFRVRAHPGGWIPDWVAGWVSKRIPIDTLLGLRRQVAKTAGRYEKFLNKWDPARRPSPTSPRGR